MHTQQIYKRVYTKVSTLNIDKISKAGPFFEPSIKGQSGSTAIKQVSALVRFYQNSTMSLRFITFIMVMLSIGCSTMLRGQCGSAFAIQASCTNDAIAPLTAYLQISAIPPNTDSYSWSQGATYDAGAAIGDNTFIPISSAGLPAEFIGQGAIPNPTGSQEYTIRFFRNLLTVDLVICDITVTLNEQTCTIGCDCVDQLYLNEPGIGTVYKFSVDPSDGDLTAIGNPWYGGSELPSPHGLGVDLNGFLYIGEYPGSGSRVRKLTCAGEILDETDFAYANDGSFNISSYDGVLYTNDISFTNNGGITAYDACEDSELGSLTFCESGTGDFDYDWGLWIDQNTATGYAANMLFLPGGVTEYYLHIFDVSDLDMNGGTACSTAALQITDFPSPADWTIYGITTDLNGNIYMVMTAGSSFSSATVISKYDASLNHIGFSAVDNNPNDGGYAFGAAIVYSAAADKLYVASQSEFESCLTSFSTDLTIIEEKVGPSAVAGTFFKGMSIVTECCPTNNNQTINRVLCSNSSSEDILLNEEFPCQGIICEGEWVPSDAASLAVFDACKQTIMAGTVPGCYSFTRSSDGSDVNSRCEAFTLTFNLEIFDISAPGIAGDLQTCADNNDPAAFTFTTPASSSGSAISYQWQSSTTDCTTGFTNIPGAPTDGTAYDPPALSQETYYRLISVVNGTCSSGMCADTSNCVTLTINPNPTATAAATDPTCLSGSSTVNSDGMITLSNFGATDKFAYTTGGSYSGSATYATGSTTIPVGGVIENSLVNPSGSQQYTVRIFNNDDCYVDRTVMLNETSCTCTSPIITALSDEAICAGGNFTPANITTSVTNGVSVNYQWYNANGTDNPTTTLISGQETATLTDLPTTAGSYTFRVVATNILNANCQVSQSVTLIINPNPTATAVASNPTTCSGSDGSIALTLTNVIDGTYTINYMDATPANQTFTNVMVTAGSATISNLSAGAYNNLTITVAGCNSTEDVDLTLSETCIYDYGDLPDNTGSTGPLDYQTQMSNNGPSHLIINGLRIGATIDDETDGQASSDAQGDSLDEDGFAFSHSNAPDIAPGGILRLPFNIINTTGIIAHFEGWIDWNGDGEFGLGEQILNANDEGTGDFGTNTFTVPIPVSGVVLNQNIGIRFRLSHTDNMTPYGVVLSGEVEDYLINLSCPPTVCLPVQLTVRRSSN